MADLFSAASFSTSQGILGIIGNFINIVYNVPQIIRTFRCKSTRDISGTFLLLRFIASLVWLAYGLNPVDIYFIVLNGVTAISTLLISYFKIKEIIADCRGKQYTFSDDNSSGQPIPSLRKTVSSAAFPNLFRKSIPKEDPSGIITSAPSQENLLKDPSRDV